MSDTATRADGHGHGDHGHDGIGHVMPIPVLVGVFLALLFFTFATVQVANLQFGRIDILISMAIATVKATLVILYFMHLRYDNPFNAIIVVASLAFVGLFIAFSCLDTAQYQGDIHKAILAAPK